MIRIMFSGDDHLSWKNYGGHVDYPQESLYYFKLLTMLAENYGVTYWIGLGDLTYGRFGSLEYRQEVEGELEKQRALVHGNRWIIKGNHDKASYGMTEYEYYLKKGLFRGSERLEFGNALTIHMRDYGDTSPLESLSPGKNILATHGLFTFKNSNLPIYGKANADLDDMAGWYGLDYIISGHIHNEHVLSGYIGKNGQAKPCTVHYIPCLTRPSYLGERTPSKGCVDLVDIKDTGEVQLYTVEIELLPLEKSFDLERIQHNKDVDDRKVDLTDILTTLKSHSINIGNPEDIIMNKQDIPLVYREKAVELLKAGLN